MNFETPVRCCLLCLGAASAALAQQSAPADPERLPRVVVSGFNDPARDWFPLNLDYQQPTPAAHARAQDAATLLDDTPGVAIVRNGPQTGLPQLRGLHADRVKVLVDGMTLTPACPNHMDPPLHYLAPASAGSLLVLPGVTPVSLGGDSLAGTVVAESARPHFNTNRVFKPFGELSGAGYSVNDGWAAAATAGLASRDYSFAYDGSVQGADDYRFPGGRVRASGYDIMHHRVRAAAETLRGQLRAETGLSRTRDAGTPALPMDMIEDDGYHSAIGFDGDFTVATLQSRAFFHHADHLMDNYSLRPAGPRRLFSPARSSDFGFNTGGAIARDSQTCRLGLDFHGNWFDAYQQNAVSARRQTTINDGTRHRLGAYAEWQNDWSSRWRTLAGLRADTVWSDTGPVEDWFPEAQGDAEAFNRTRRAISDLNLDALVAVRFTPSDGAAYELGVARKNRAPSLIERYLWTPLSASAGQADGRTYLGNLDLDPETAWQFNLAADWRGRRWQFKVSPFFTLVDGYIQGGPGDRLDMNQRPVLAYANLDQARLYGVDAAAGWEFLPDFKLSGALSYVRGTDEEHDDNLYRIAPLRGRLELAWSNGRLEAAVAGVLVAEQDEVSAYNGEPPTPGYALVHLRAGWNISRHVNLQVGLENVFDEAYAAHLGGINRVAGGDVGVGERLPGYGRSGYVALRLRWE
jgi:iron complex outermembrane receptor protein